MLSTKMFTFILSTLSTYIPVAYHRTGATGGALKYSVIQKDSLNFVCLYFLNCTRYMDLKEEVLNFQIPPLERSPSTQPCSSVSWEQNGYYAGQDFFGFVSSLKLSRRLLCGVRFVFFSIFSCGIWKFRTSSFKCYVDHPHTVYSSGNIGIWNWVHFLNHTVYQILLTAQERSGLRE